MEKYQVGSLANLVTLKSENGAKKEPVQKNQSVLDQLFAASNTTNGTVTVEHVPISGKPVKTRKKKRKVDEFNIVNIAKGKKLRKAEGSDSENDEEIEKILNLPDDEAEEDDETTAVSENVSRKLKKIENKNLKRKAEKKMEEEERDRVVIVKNLPIKVKRKSIQKLFSKCGTVDAVWLRCAALPDTAMPKKVAVIKQDFHPDRQSITAFVRFEEPESVKAALKMTGVLFQEHHLAISSIREDAKREMGKGIFIGNLTFGAEDEALWQHFAECGRIEDVRIIRDPTNGMGKGFGYVNFESADSVELALKLNGSLLNNREIRVDRCKSKPKKAKTNFAQRLNSRGSKDRGGDDESGGKGKKKSGAYRRIQMKNNKLEKTQKDAGWIKAMKQRQKVPKGSSTQVQSYAGETTASDGKSNKPKRLGKAIKKTKEELRKRSIAAKLTRT